METLMTAEEVAERLRQNPSTIRRWSKVGILPALKVGRRVLFSPEEIQSWVEDKKLFDSPQERLRQLTSWSHSHAKRHGFDKLSEKEIERIVDGNRKRHREAEDRI